MKPFQILLLLTVLILIGGMAALYWGKTVEDATAPVEVVEESVVVVEEPVKRPNEEPATQDAPAQAGNDEPTTSTLLPIILTEDLPVTENGVRSGYGLFIEKARSPT